MYVDVVVTQMMGEVGEETTAQGDECLGAMVIMEVN
jgi:hypothetical protein